MDQYSSAIAVISPLDQFLKITFHFSNWTQHHATTRETHNRHTRTCCKHTYRHTCRHADTDILLNTHSHRPTHFPQTVALCSNLPPVFVSWPSFFCHLSVVVRHLSSLSISLVVGCRCPRRCLSVLSVGLCAHEKVCSYKCIYLNVNVNVKVPE